MEPDVWGEVLRPTLSVHQGRAVFIGTPAGRNHFYDLFQKADNPPEWGRLHIPASASGVLGAAELASAKAAMTAEQFSQEYECDWLTVSGRSIYGALMDQAHRDGRIGHVPHRPGYDVWTSWDLGKRDATAIWAWQKIGPAYHLINFYQASGLTITDCAEVVLKEWGGRQGYRYAIGGHLLPHDADTDVFSAEGTTAEKGRALGLDLTVVEKTGVASGINRVRQLLPQCWFDEAKCAEGVEALTHYSYAWNPEMGAFSMKPEHNRWSHAADAFRYFAVGHQEPPDESELRDLKSELQFNPFTYERQNPGLQFRP